MKKILIAVLFTCLYACSGNTSRQIDKEKLTFNYRDDAYIFFRNIRQAKYNLEVMEEAGWRIYRHEDFDQESGEYLLKIALVVNWKANKAYAILELPEEINKEYLTITWKGEEGHEGKIILTELSRQSELGFLTEVYNHIAAEHSLYWQPEGKEMVNVFTQPDQREAFRVSMYDFYRLTALL